MLFLLLGAFALVALFAACRKTYEEQLVVEQMRQIRQFVGSKGKGVWVIDSICYSPVDLGDSIAPQEGEQIGYFYTLYALTGGDGTMLATNIIADARTGNLPLPVDSTKYAYHTVGQTDSLIKGLRCGLEYFAHLSGSGWLGIPSRLAYGKHTMAGVKPNTPLACYIHVVEYSGNIIERP